MVRTKKGLGTLGEKMLRAGVVTQKEADTLDTRIRPAVKRRQDQLKRLAKKKGKRKKVVGAAPKPSNKARAARGGRDVPAAGVRPAKKPKRPRSRPAPRPQP